MEKRESVLYQWIAYSFFRFSYLQAFYKPNNITIKRSFKVKSYFQSQPNKETEIFHFAPTWGIKNEARMGKLLKGVTQLLQNFEMNLMPVLLLYFSSYRSIKTWNLYFKNMEKKAIRWCIETPKHFHY